ADRIRQIRRAALIRTIVHIPCSRHPPHRPYESGPNRGVIGSTGKRRRRGGRQPWGALRPGALWPEPPYGIGHINEKLREKRMPRQFTTAQSRRAFLKRSSALAALGITTSFTPDLAFGQAKSDLSGVTIDYWNMIGIQNPIIRKISEDIIAAFEQKTGCTVNVTWNGYGDIIGPKYRTNFTGGIKPTVFDTSSRWVNQLREFLYPFNDLVYGDWDEETRAGVEWMFPLNEEENRGFPDKDQIYGLPFN